MAVLTKDDVQGVEEMVHVALTPPYDRWNHASANQVLMLAHSHEELRAERDAAVARLSKLEETLRAVRPQYDHNYDCGFFAYRWGGKSECNCGFAKAHRLIDEALAFTKEGQ